MRTKQKKGVSLHICNLKVKKKLTGEESVQKAKHGELRLNFQVVPSVASKRFAVAYHTVGRLAVALFADQYNEGELICPLYQMYCRLPQVSCG
jgi:hypothetical protein